MDELRLEIRDIYNEDMAEKNSVKKSARCKKGGSATSKLGNRRMSWKEIQEKHGAVVEYKMNRFMDFNEFKAMPKDLQVEYLNSLQEKYDVGIKHISKWLFSIGDEGLQSHLRINDILKLCNVDKKRGKTGLQNFIDDISAYKKNRKAGVLIDFEGGEVMSEIPARNKACLMTYEEYTKMGPTERLEWVNRVIEDYDTTATTISEVLFKKNPGTLWVYFKSHNLVDRLSHKNTSGTMDEKISRKKAFQKEVDAWRKFQGLEESTNENEERDICFASSIDSSEDRAILPSDKVLLHDPVTGTFFTSDNEKIHEVSNTLNNFIDSLQDSQPANTLNDFIDSLQDSQPAEEYHDLSIHSNYIRVGLDMEEFYRLSTLFSGKKVKVNIEISVI